jgi:hypothetical protein
LHDRTERRLPERPAFSVYSLKGVIGGDKKPEDAQAFGTRSLPRAVKQRNM